MEKFMFVSLRTLHSIVISIVYNYKCYTSWTYVFVPNNQQLKHSLPAWLLTPGIKSLKRHDIHDTKLMQIEKSL